MDSTINNYLKGLKVIELATVLAGPTVGMFFAELGAEVIKIESLIGDVTRGWKLQEEDANNKESAYFYSANYNKQYLSLNLNNKVDYKQAILLIQEADIIISNFKPSSAKKLRIDYEDLQKINPSVVYAQLVSFDHDIDRPAYDVIIQAESGFLSMTGLDKEQLCKMPVALIDLIAAHQMKEAILLALIKRMLSGKGSYIEVSLLDAGITALANQASNYLNAGFIAQPMGLLHPNIAPYGETFVMKDGTQIVLAVTNDDYFHKLLGVLGLESDKLYSNNILRLQNRSKLYDYLESAITRKETESLIFLLDEHKIPYGIIKRIDQVMQTAKDRNLVLSEEINGRATQRIKTVAFKIK